MRFLIAACLATLSVVSAHRVHVNQPEPHSEAQLEQLFTSFVKQHNKQYTHDDFFNRFHIFKTNVEKIRKHNLTGAKYTLGLNEFADQTWSEFRSARLGYKHQDRSVLRSANEEDLSSSSAASPSSVDWRTKNIITPVKDQGQCGSCWAFSTTGSVEAAHATATGTLISLSEQELVDCSTKQGNQGCNGGLMDNAFQYIISNKGIGTEASYPYKGTGPNTCKKVTSVATISSFKDVTAGSESALLTAVAGRPVSVAIEADQESFQLYSGGVLTAKCGTNLDHGVLAVGYGTDNGTDYWIVKNSWGASWGEQGYIRLERGINQCGIANSASYPIA